MFYQTFRENALDSVEQKPGNDEDDSTMVKRTPWGRRRRRRRRRRGGWGRRVWRKVKEFGRKIHQGLKKVCHWVRNSQHHSKF